LNGLMVGALWVHGRLRRQWGAWNVKAGSQMLMQLVNPVNKRRETIPTGVHWVLQTKYLETHGFESCWEGTQTMSDCSDGAAMLKQTGSDSHPFRYSGLA
jgi:hypothetical protein